MTLAVNRQRATREPAPSRTDQPPRLCEGVTLLGEYEGSGYKDPHYLARRKTGGVVQLSELLFLVADACDGNRSTEQIAAQASERYGKQLTEANVDTLLDKLRPLGVIVDRDGTSPEVREPDPLLALRWRVSLVNKGAVRRVTAPFRWLFWPVVIPVVGLALLGLDWWLFFVHGLSQPIRQTINDPVTFLLVAGLIIASAAFHEIGHAAACVYSGGEPGRMGAGVYLAWPAFYTDVTDAYRLSRAGRLRTDLGGIYFNAVFVLVMGAAWRLTGFEPLLLVAFLMQVEIVQQLLPFLRLDGYYVLSDIAGVPDLFRRIPAVLRSVVPGRKMDERVTELKRWVRVMVIGWTLTVVPLLLVNLTLAIVSAPRIIATAWHSGAKLVYNFDHASNLLKAADALQLLFLAVPVAGLVFTFVRVGKRAAVGSWRWSSDSPAKRGFVLAVTTAAIIGIAVAWWPDGRVTPYRPGERGTLTQQVSSFRDVARGRPLLQDPKQAATQPLPPVSGNTTAGDLARQQSSPSPPSPQPTPTPHASASPTSEPTGGATSTAPSASASPSSSASPSPTATPTTPAPTTTP